MITLLGELRSIIVLDMILRGTTLSRTVARNSGDGESFTSGIQSPISFGRILRTQLMF